MYPDLQQTLSKFGKVSDEEMLAVANKLQVLNLKKNEHFVKEGEIANYVAFVRSGYLRIYFNHEGEESTRDISSINSFVTAFASFISKTPSFEVVRAITKCELLIIHRNDLNGLYKQFPALGSIGRRIMEEMFVRMQKRMYSLLTLNAEARYRNLMKEKPDFLQNIPLQFIASYLGITSQSLSRLRRTIFDN
ncbi:MAG: Crp/Fnr family transcriptional regulator [Bacteroidales bacterium]|nr:Crp/Fnr family transcriptional regulator [Bacteroidales bacterium]